MRRSPDPLELLVFGALGLFLVGLALFAAAPVLAVALPTFALLALVPRRRRWPVALALLLGSAAALATQHPAEAWRTYVTVQRETGTMLLDMLLAGTSVLSASTLAAVFLPPSIYLPSVLPAALYGLPLAALAHLVIRLSHAFVPKEQPDAERTERTPLLLADAHTLATEPVQPVDWAVPGVVGRGVLSLLSAPPKAGKGWATWAMLRAMQHRGTWFGLPVHRQRVLWLTEEGESFGKTAAAFGISAGDVRVLRRQDVRGWTWTELVPALRAKAQAAECGLVIVDTVRAWCPQAEQTPELAYGVAEQIRQELLSHGIGVLLVHHDRKGGGSYGEGVAGTNALVGTVDVLIELKRVQGNDAARRILTSGRFEPLDRTAILRGHRYEPLDSEPVREVPAHLAAVLGVVCHFGTVGALAADVQEALGLSKTQINGRLHGLLDAGLVSRTGAGTRTEPFRYVARDATPPVPPLEREAYSAYLQSAEWRKRAEGIMVRAGGTCERCKQGPAASVHHLTYARLGAEDDGDLLALCSECHGVAHTEQREAVAA